MVWTCAVSPAPGSPPLAVYLGPDVPRWTPTSLEDVRTLVTDGTLKEGHWLDAKANIGRTAPAKVELARDLASFANDGGALLVGVREDRRKRTFMVDPVDLADLSELVDQVARSRCDPPLFTICLPLVDPGTPDHGVLLIVIPPSASAPHMVDQRYLGRSDTTKYQMSDSEVTRWHAVRSSRQLTAAQLVEAEIARDPVPADERQLGHLYVVAQPLSSPPGLLTALIGSTDLSNLVRGITSLVPPHSSPNWTYLADREPRVNGDKFRSYGMIGRQYRPGFPDLKESGVMDLEVDDDGRLVLFAGGITRPGKAAFADQADLMILDGMVADLAKSVLALAGLLGSRTGYPGRWLLALGLTGLKGKMSFQAVNRTGVLPVFSADRYTKGTEAVTAELLERPADVAEQRLLWWLRRALGTVHLQ
jgi:hypothetical protein